MSCTPGRATAHRFQSGFADGSAVGLARVTLAAISAFTITSGLSKSSQPHLSAAIGLQSGRLDSKVIPRIFSRKIGIDWAP
jgi:hypothetical protein